MNAGDKRPMNHVNRPEIFLPGGQFAILGGVEYLAMVINRTSNVVVQVPPNQSPPEPGLEKDPSGWSRKVYRNSELDRVFSRDTFITWRDSLWYVAAIRSDSLTFDCKWNAGRVSFSELRKDSRVQQGDEPSVLWAHLTIDDIDALAIDETEFVDNVKVAATSRRIYTWFRADSPGGQAESTQQGG